MRHQGLVGAIEAAELGEVIGVGNDALVEILRETGKAGVERVAAHMDDARVRQRQADEAEKAKLAGVLLMIRSAAGASARMRREVIGAESAPVRAVMRAANSG